MARTLENWGTKENPISITSMQSYSKCPQKFQYIYNGAEADKKETSIFLAGGTSVHETIEKMMRNNWVIPVTRWKNEQELFMDEWTKVVQQKIRMGMPIDKSPEELLKKQAEYEQMAVEFYRREVILKRINPIWSEATFFMEIPSWDPGKTLWVKGTVDLLCELEGEFCLMDFKSNKVVPSQVELDRNLQFGTYYLACKYGTFKDYNDNDKPFKINKFPEVICWYQLRANEKYKRNGRSKNKEYKKGEYKGDPLNRTYRYPDMEDAIIREIQIRAKAVQNEIFFIDYNMMTKCEGCNFQLTCNEQHGLGCNNPVKTAGVTKTLTIDDSDDSNPLFE